jgi:hypothetical protein
LSEFEEVVAVLEKAVIMENAIFESAVRTSGDLAGIFEYDEEGGYFYLFDLTKNNGSQARGVIFVAPKNIDFQPLDVSVKWNEAQDIVGLYVHHDLWAAFDQQGRKYGGIDDTRKAPSVPAAIIEQFT